MRQGCSIQAVKCRLVAIFGAVVVLSPMQATAQQHGMASVYSYGGGHRTASGGRVNPGALTAAHRSLPFGSRLKVTNKRNGRSVVVTINDRGPFVRGRIVDLTPAGAQALGFTGVAPVVISRE